MDDARPGFEGVSITIPDVAGPEQSARVGRKPESQASGAAFVTPTS